MATEGERWTAEALDALRTGEFSARAWQTFLAASLERSRSARRQRPALARQAARWGATGAAAWLVACGLARGRDGAREQAPSRRRRAHPRTAVARARVPGVAHSRAGLPGVIVLGALTDFADGRLARAHGSTRLGRDLDTTADLAFVSVAGVAALRAGRLSAVGAGALGARHALGLSVSLHAYFGRGRRPAPPSAWAARCAWPGSRSAPRGTRAPAAPCSWREACAAAPP